LNGSLQEKIEHWFAQGAEAIGNKDAEAAFFELRGALESLHALPDEHAQRTLLALAERARPRPIPARR